MVEVDPLASTARPVHVGVYRGMSGDGQTEITVRLGALKKPKGTEQLQAGPNIYRNARVANGVSSVTAENFRQGRFGSISHTTGSQIREEARAGPVACRADGRESAVFESRGGWAPARRTLISSARTPVAAAGLFAEQQRAMQQFSRPPASSSMARTAGGGAAPGGWRSTTSPASVGAGQVRSATPSGAWRPANDPAAERSSGGGWQRFGEPAPAVHMHRVRHIVKPVAASAYRPYATSAPAAGSGPQSIRVAPPVVREKSAETSKSTARSQSSSSHASSGAGAHSGGQAPTAGAAVIDKGFQIFPSGRVHTAEAVAPTAGAAVIDKGFQISSLGPVPAIGGTGPLFWLRSITKKFT